MGPRSAVPFYWRGEKEGGACSCLHRGHLQTRDQPGPNWSLRRQKGLSHCSSLLPSGRRLPKRVGQPQRPTLSRFILSSAAEVVMETNAPGLSEYLRESLCGAMSYSPFCQLPLGVTSPGPEEPANKRPCKPESHWLGAPSPVPLGRRDSAHSLWFGCTLGAWVHHTAGWPSSADQTGTPGIQKVSSELLPPQSLIHLVVRAFV